MPIPHTRSLRLLLCPLAPALVLAGCDSLPKRDALPVAASVAASVATPATAPPPPAPSAHAPGPAHTASAEPGTQGPTEEALVLGLRGADGTLKSYFVDAASITPIGDGIAVPRHDGWWRLIRVIQQQDTVKEQSFYSARAGQKVALRPLEDTKRCDSQVTETLLFVGTDWASIELEGGGMCEGAAHPWAAHTLGTYPIDGLQRSTAGDIGHLVGVAATPTLLAQGRAARAGDDCLVEEPSPDAFGLIRAHGEWIVRGALVYASEACRSAFKLFNVDAPPPKSLTGATPLPRAWSTYAVLAPDVLDAVASPSARLVVLVTKAGLTLRVDDRAVAQLAAPGTAIVLVQWEVGGANVARWRTDSARALASP